MKSIKCKFLFVFRKQLILPINRLQDILGKHLKQQIYSKSHISQSTTDVHFAFLILSTPYSHIYVQTHLQPINTNLMKNGNYYTIFFLLHIVLYCPDWKVHLLVLIIFDWLIIHINRSYIVKFLNITRLNNK